MSHAVRTLRRPPPLEKEEEEEEDLLTPDLLLTLIQVISSESELSGISYIATTIER